MIEELTKQWMQAMHERKPCFARVAHEGKVGEFKVVFIYDRCITFEVSNGKGGHSYLRLSHDEFQYPLYSTASRAAVSFAAAQLYFTDRSMGESKRKKQEALQDEYIAAHWYDVYETVCRSVEEFYVRQRA